MKKLFFWIILFLASSSANCQNQDDFDSLVKNLHNYSLDSLRFSPFFSEINENNDVTERKTIVYSEDIIVRQIVKLGKENTQKLIALFEDPERDYAANIILYYLYRKDAFILSSFYLGIDKIETWRNLQKDEDYILWMQVSGQM